MGPEPMPVGSEPSSGVPEPTPRQLVRAVSARLGSAVEAGWIVEHAVALSGKPTIGAPSASSLDDPVMPGVAGRVESLVARCEAGEPLQYVLGHWSFRTIEVTVDPRVLIPRPETEQVVEVALAELRRARARRTDRSPANPPVAVDLGTGSGVIALSLAIEGAADHPDLEVWATDSSSEALEVASANLRVLLPHTAGVGRAGLDGAGAVGGLSGVRLAHGAWFSALPPGLAGSIDLVVSNPPYVSAAEHLELDPVVRDWEPENALVAGPAGDGSAGLADVEAIIAGAPRWLAPGGGLVIELAPRQAGEAVAMARRSGLVDVRVEPDLAGRPRVLVAER